MHIVIIGASGSIGAALCAEAARRWPGARIRACARQPQRIAPGTLPPGSTTHALDLTRPDTIAQAARQIGGDGPVDVVILASGLLHGPDFGPEKSLAQIEAGAMAQVLAVNTIGPALVAQAFLPLLPRDRWAVFAALSARVGSISDNHLGGWYSYRASKAALNMVLRCAAIETARRAPLAIVAGLHPGTVASDLSAPFARGVPPGRLFSPARAAGHLWDVICALTPEQSGQVLAWDGTPIPA